jgi:cytochrome c biogenesis protein CcmG/thiol:disulfide interchange protein DsbE
MKRLFWFIPLAVFIAIAYASWLGLGRDPAALPSALIDRPMPQFELAPVREGDGAFSRADLEGQVALVNVFASWCGPCRIEHPTLIELRTQQDVPIYGINWKESPADGRGYLAEAGDPYLKIGSDESGRFALDLGVTGAPETFIVDRHGRIRYKQVGPITPEVWARTIAPIVTQLESEP